MIHIQCTKIKHMIIIKNFKNVKKTMIKIFVIMKLEESKQLKITVLIGKIV